MEKDHEGASNREEHSVGSVIDNFAFGKRGKIAGTKSIASET